MESQAITPEILPPENENTSLAINNQPPTIDLSKKQKSLLSKFENELTPKQLKGLKNLIIAGFLPKDIESRCKLLEITPATWYRWEEQTVFVSALKEVCIRGQTVNWIAGLQIIGNAAGNGDLASHRHISPYIQPSPTTGTQAQAQQVVLNINRDA